MKIKRIEYEIEPINDFFRIVIFEEENKFKIGLSFIGNFGTDSFIIFKKDLSMFVTSNSLRRVVLLFLLHEQKQMDKTIVINKICFIFYRCLNGLTDFWQVSSTFPKRAKAPSRI